MNPFSALTSKIFAGVSVALLLLLGIQQLRLNHANGVIEEQTKAMAELTASLRLQNAAVQRLHDEGVQARAAFEAAISNGQRLLTEARGQVTVIRQQSRPNGCPTSEVIRNAPL